MTEIVTCNECGFSGSPNLFPARFDVYHDLSCPRCGTSNLDTTEINKAWAARGEKYGYGNNNTLDVK